VGKRVIEEVQSNIPNVDWRVKKGGKIEIPNAIAANIIAIARKLAPIEMQIDQLRKEAEPYRGAIKQYAQIYYPNLRGIKDREEKFILRIDPHTIKWDKEGLKKWLQTTYESKVPRKLIIEIEGPLFSKQGLIPLENVAEAFKEFLRQKGVDVEAVVTIEEKVIGFNEEDIKKFESIYGPLPEGVRTIDFKIHVEPLAEG